MAIQVRRGNEADFDASKMLPGEWAVSLDTRYVRMCFAPGIVLRMATYEGFESEKAQIQAILAECETIQSAVQRIQTEVNAKASLTIEYSNSAKESADRAYNEAERAKTYANNAEAVTGVNIATQDRVGLVKGGDNYIAEDGTLTLIKKTFETTMPNSHAGRLLIEEIGGGESQQGENPSPDNPQEIKKTVVSEVRTHGKNFIKNKLTSGTRNGITYAKNSDGSIVLNGTASATTEFDVSNFVVDKDSAYILSGCPSGGSGSTYSLRYYEWDESWKQLTRNNDYGEGVVLNHNDSAVNITTRIVVVSGVTVSNLTFYPMIREVGTDATFEPYTESVITLSQPIELYGIGDVKDVIEGDKVERKYGVAVMDGDENWTISAIDTEKYRLELYIGSQAGSPNHSVSANAMCNQFFVKPLNVVRNGNEEGFGINSTGSIVVYSEQYNTEDALDAWKAHLAEHPMTVVFELAEETTEELPIADQIALNSLSTFDGITYLEFDSEIEPTFKGEYGTSKVGGYTLEGMLAGRNGELMGNDYANRITALEATVVNNI